MADAPRPWWSSWWAVILWGVLTLLAVLPASIGWNISAWVPVATTEGTDMQGDGAPGVWVRWLAGFFGVAVLLLPGMTALWARKIWLGYLLLGLALSVLVLIVGLLMFGIL